MSRSRLMVAGVTVAIVTMLASCGSSSGTSGTSSGRQGIPDVTVTDVASGESVTLASVTEPDRPTLVWFWAPF